MLNLDPFFRDFDRLTQRLWGSPALGGANGASIAPLDAWREGDAIVVELDLPGITPESLDVSVDHDVLTVHADRAEPTDEGTWLAAERPHGAVTRQLLLGPDVNVDKIDADYSDGVLRLTIPISEAVKPRKIAVVPGAQQAISA